jgi:hypothetical protein
MSLKPWPQPITTTRQARLARRIARENLIRRHDVSLTKLRERLADPRATDSAATINYHFDRMEYHIEHLEAGT